jgi:hypothetical protein
VQYLSSQQIDGYTPMLSPGALYGVTVTNPGPLQAALASGWLSDFADVPQSSPWHADVEKIFRASITGGCGAGNFCPSMAVARAQMAIFLLKGQHGASFVPPNCTGIFADVPCPGLIAPWVEELWRENISDGCGGGDFCPAAPVTRETMVVLLLKTKHGSGFVPPPCTGIFADVSCPGPFADWIEELYAEGITGGCQTEPLLYCPDSAVTRGQMAVFLTRTFGLQ